MRDFSKNHEWLSLNTATVRKQHGQEVPLPQILEQCARLDIRCIAPWRDQIHATGLKETSKLVRSHNLALSGVARGGMFTAVDDAGLKLAAEDNRRAVDEACELRAACLVLVVGALPGALQGKAVHKDIALSRQQAVDGVGTLLEYARKQNMPLAIEPLHPMYAADRACINMMEHALDVCDALDPSRSGALGVAVDMYHVWWDPKLKAQIERAGKSRLLAFHVCDWLVPTTDLLLDRGMPGDGVIDIQQARGWVEAQGFAGFAEVEIFSNRWWALSGEETLKTCIERHKTVV
jgi:sugar phosphate isomerase/epimerase